MTDQRSLYMDEWQLYWVCFSRQDIRECLAATNERLNCESWANQRARAGLWTGYTSGGGGRDELMSGFCHLIGHKGSINVSDWFSVLQLPINLHALKACIHNLLLLHVNICFLFWIHKKKLIFLNESAWPGIILGGGYVVFTRWSQPMSLSPESPSHIESLDTNRNNKITWRVTAILTGQRLRRILSSVYHVCCQFTIFLASWYHFSAPLIHLGARSCHVSSGWVSELNWCHSVVSVSWVSHLTGCHTRLTSTGDKCCIMESLWVLGLLFSGVKEGFEK